MFVFFNIVVMNAYLAHRIEKLIEVQKHLSFADLQRVKEILSALHRSVSHGWKRLTFVTLYIASHA